MWTVSDQPAGHDVLDRVMGPGLPVGDEGQLWFARSSGLSGGWPEGYLPAKGLTVTKAFLSQSQVTEPESCFLLLLLLLVVWFVFLFCVCVCMWLEQNNVVGMCVEVHGSPTPKA